MTLGRKVLLIGLLNLSLLALGLALFIGRQRSPGEESVLLGPARERILSLGNSFELAMRSNPKQAQPGLLDSFGKNYHAEFLLTDPLGETVTAKPAQLPPEVINRLRHPHLERPPAPQNDRKKKQRGKKKQEAEDEADAHPDDADEPDRRPPPAEEKVFLEMAKSSPGYWVGVRMPIVSSDDLEPRDGLLLIHTASFFSNDLLFDWLPWFGVPVGVLVVSALCWLPFVRGLTHSVSQMSRVTGRMALGEFDARVADSRRDELGQLGAEINDLAARLSGFVNNQKRFLGDIAHELSAPLARIQFALGILEQKALSQEQPQVAVLHQPQVAVLHAQQPQVAVLHAQQPQVAVLRDEIQEMSALVSELLSFSKVGMDPASAILTPVSLAVLVERAISREAPQPGAIERNVDPSLRVLANETLLLRAVSNILRNALRYAGQAGPITITAAQAGDSIHLVIADSGPGVPEAALDQIFVPFYRLDSSRNRESGGAGLGLAIVKSCIDACKGTVTCANRRPSGLEITIRLKTATT